MLTYKKAENEKGVLKIVYDDSPESPREWDNLSRMVCFHGRYSLGDSHNYKSGDYNGWDGLSMAIKKDYDVAVILPLYLYDHSGITISTSAFSCPWDSGQVGFVFVTKEDIRNNYGIKRVTKKLIEEVEKIIISEIETYDDYLRGNVYGFILEDNEGNQIDSCFGFYGDDSIKDLGEHIEEEYISLFEKIA